MGGEDEGTMRKPVLLYAPMLYREGKGIWPPVVPSTWYYRWQKGLWQCFSEMRNELNVIWKAPPRTSSFSDPIQKMASENIRYVRGKIGRWIRKADRVLVDVPSSVVWDACKMGKLVVCLCPSIQTDIRKEFEDKMIVCFHFPQYVLYPADYGRWKGPLKKWLRDLMSGKVEGFKLRRSTTDWLKEVISDVAG